MKGVVTSPALVKEPENISSSDCEMDSPTEGCKLDESRISFVCVEYNEMSICSVDGAEILLPVVEKTSMASVECVAPSLALAEDTEKVSTLDGALDA